MPYEAIRAGGNLPAAMNAANEIAVEEFLLGNIPFCGIAQTIRAVMDTTEVIEDPESGSLARNKSSFPGKRLRNTYAMLQFDSLLGILGAAFLFGFAVFIHELGHFTVAKWLGVGVKKFAIGFGPKITSFYSRGD